MTLCNVGPASKTLGRRCINAIQMSCVCWAEGLSLKHCTFIQCWLNSINTALDHCLVSVVSCNQFSGYINAVNPYSKSYCWPTLDRPRHAHFAVESFFKTVAQLIESKDDLVTVDHLPGSKSCHSVVSGVTSH